MSWRDIDEAFSVRLRSRAIGFYETAELLKILPSFIDVDK
jgi:hypothetical protein